MLYLLEVSFDGMIARFTEKLKLVENREIVKSASATGFVFDMLISNFLLISTSR